EEEEEEEDKNDPETNIRKFSEALESRTYRKREEAVEHGYVYHEDRFDFPRDPEKWREEDLRELWADAPVEMTKPGWDPAWADAEDLEVVRNELDAGRDPHIAPFYVPYRKFYPAIPDNHHDISNPKAVIEELDRIEEFLIWVSYVFEDDDGDPEFVLINKEPEPDPEDPSELVYTEDPLILHTRTGRVINYVEDEKYGVRLFWQPDVEEEEEDDVDPDKAQFLPLGFDEFFGRSAPVKKEGKMRGLITFLQNAVKPLFDRLEHWAVEKKKSCEVNLKHIENELEFIEAEISLEEAIEDLELELKRKQEEEEKQDVAGMDQDDSSDSAVTDETETEDEDDEEAPTSFGTVNQGKADDDTIPKESKPGKSPFSSLSLSLSSPGLFSLVRCCYDVLVV
ncbi:hypothetical protein BHM03_00052744, partial [Ensete ventricosum]